VQNTEKPPAHLSVPVLEDALVRDIHTNLESVKPLRSPLWSLAFTFVQTSAPTKCGRNKFQDPYILAWAIRDLFVSGLGGADLVKDVGKSVGRSEEAIGCG
jgi:hypothetical protein